MDQYERIIRQCFWDSRISKEDITRILSGCDSGDDFRKKKQLFERILLNSSRYLLDLQLFDRDELYTLLEEYRVPEFNRDYVFRRKNIAEVFFFDKELQMGELQWTA